MRIVFVAVVIVVVAAAATAVCCLLFYFTHVSVWPAVRCVYAMFDLSDLWSPSLDTCALGDKLRWSRGTRHRAQRSATLHKLAAAHNAVKEANSKISPKL